jgi:hypothetical protein
MIIEEAGSDSRVLLLSASDSQVSLPLGRPTNPVILESIQQAAKLKFW